MEVHVANHGGEAIEQLMRSTYWRDGHDREGRLELGVVLMDQVCDSRLSERLYY